MIDCVVDVSHHQGTVDFGAVRGDGIRGVMIKASEGTNYIDSKYKSYHSAAQQAGLLCGAYHFGRHGDGVAQADHFLHATDPHDKTLLALDLEWVMAGNVQGDPMTLNQAERFVERLRHVTGRWPGVYTSSAFLNQYQYTQSPTLQRCWLWVAEYSTAATPKIPHIWNDWALWQYTETGTVKGISTKADRSRFNGSEDQLRNFWNGTTPPFPLMLCSELMMKMPVIERLFDRCAQCTAPFLCLPPAPEVTLKPWSIPPTWCSAQRYGPGEGVRILVDRMPGGAYGTLTMAFVSRLKRALGENFHVTAPYRERPFTTTRLDEDRFVHVEFRRQS
jgi:lysozyme